jgi:hypothetical protein
MVGHDDLGGEGRAELTGLADAWWGAARARAVTGGTIRCPDADTGSTRRRGAASHFRPSITGVVMAYPPQNPHRPPHGAQQPPHGQVPAVYGPPGGQPPVVYGAPTGQHPAVYGPPQGQPPAYGPPPGYGYPQQQPVQVRQVGHSVTKPVWTLTQIALVVFSVGFLWPVVWLYRRSKTTVTRHY